MPGLLDFLNSDDARLGIGLLAASGPQTDPTKTGLGYALQAAMADVDARKKAALQNQYLQSQIQDTSAQAKAREAELALKQQKQGWLIGLTQPGGGAAPAPSAPTGDAPTAPTGITGSGLLSYGGQAVTPATTDTPTSPAGFTSQLRPETAAVAQSFPVEQRSWLQQVHDRTGADLDAMIADIATNDGKNLSTIVKEASAPKFLSGPGGVQQVARATPGQGVGGYTIATDPQGVDLYRRTEEAKAQAAAGGRVTTMRDPAQGNREVPLTDAQLIAAANARGAAPATPPPPATVQPVIGGPRIVKGSLNNNVAPGLPPAEPGMVGSFDVGRDGKVDVQRAMSAVNGMTNPQEKANAWSALQNQIAKEDAAAGVPPTPAAVKVAAAAGPVAAPAVAPPTPGAKSGYFKDFSPEEKGTQAASDEYKKLDAKSLQEMGAQIRTSGFNSNAKIASLTRLDQLLGNFEGGKYGKDTFELARGANSFGLKIDPKLPNKEAAEALTSQYALEQRNPSGGAGMPGGLSNTDRDYLYGMSPGMAQSAEGRKTIINNQIALAKRDQEVAGAANKWVKQYGQLTPDFFDQLQDYSNKHPLFSKAAP